MADAQNPWSEADIACAYARVVTRTHFYQQMMRDIASHVGEAKRILDMGCGVGALLAVLARDPTLSLVGIDRSVAMLDIAKRELSCFNSQNVNISLADAAEYGAEGDFDCVVASNVLNIAERPYDLMENACRILRPGGVFIVSGPKNNPDMAAVFSAMRSTTLPEDMPHLTLLETLNTQNLQASMHTFNNDDLEKILLRYAGFKEIQHSGRTYLDQNHLVVAKKSLSEETIVYKIASTPEELTRVFELRYHLLHDRIGYLEESSLKMDESVYDADAISVIAESSQSGNVIGCLTLVLGDVSGLPEQETLGISNELNLAEKIASPYRWMVLPKYRGTGVGKRLFKELYLLSLQRGVTYWAFPINPALRSFFVDKLGCAQVGPEQKYHNKTGIPLHLKLDAIGPERFV